MRINTTLIGILALVSLTSCSLGAEFELVSNHKICVSNKQVVAVDMLNFSVTKEITITQDLNSWSESLSGNAYIHMTAFDSTFVSLFASNLESHIASLDKGNLPIEKGLIKVADEGSAGVFHLFDSSSALSMKDFIGSCFTISETTGECRIETDSGKYYLQADIPLEALKEWKLIRRHLIDLPNKLSC